MIVTLKENGYSERVVSVTMGSSKIVAHTTVSYFTKLRMYGNKKRIELPRIRSAREVSMMKTKVERSPRSLVKNHFSSIHKVAELGHGLLPKKTTFHLLIIDLAKLMIFCHF